MTRGSAVVVGERVRPTVFGVVFASLRVRILCSDAGRVSVGHARYVVGLRAVGRALPSPLWLAVWIMVTGVVPVELGDGARPLESWRSPPAVFWYTAVALLVLTAVVAARWTTRVGDRGDGEVLVTSAVVATVVGAAYIVLYFVVYRWVVPLGVPAGAQALGLLPVAMVGGVIGHLFGLTGRGHQRRPRKARYLLGALITVLGVLVGPHFLAQAARHSTVTAGWALTGFEADRSRGKASVVAAVAAGHYAVYVVDGDGSASDCRVTGAGIAERHIRLVTIPVHYSNDATSYTWVATMHAPTAGTYRVTCPFAWYGLNDPPPIKGAIGAIIHWPRPLILILCALPGVLVIADTTRRRRHE